MSRPDARSALRAFAEPWRPLGRSENWCLDRTTLLCVGAIAFAIGFELTTARLALVALGALVVPFAMAVACRWPHAQPEPPSSGRTRWLWFAAAGVITLAAWSAVAASPMFSARTALLVAALISAVAVVQLGAPRFDQARRDHVLRAILVVYALCAAYGLIEEVTDHGIKRVLFWPFRIPQWVDGRMVLSFTHSVEIPALKSNFNMVALIFLGIPVLQLLGVHYSSQAARIARALIIIVVGIAVILSVNLTAKLALLAGLLAVVAAKRWYWSTIIVLAVLWVASFAAVIPIAKALYASGAQSNPNLPYTLRHRIVIWDHTIERMAAKPVFGVGPGTTRWHFKRETDPVDDRSGFRRTLEVYAHNIYLQAWFELGAVGVALLAAFGLALLAWIARLRRGTGAYALGLFTAVMVLGKAGYGLFAPWLLATMTIGVALLVMAHAWEPKRFPQATGVSHASAV